jgi:hypothetical protein
MRFVLISLVTLLACASCGASSGTPQVPAGTSYALAPLLRAHANTAPTITSVTPTSGAPGDGFTINGSGFTGATNLSFEPIGATDIFGWSFSVISDNQMTGLNGGGPAKRGDLIVTTASGPSAKTSSDQYTNTN